MSRPAAKRTVGHYNTDELAHSIAESNCRQGLYFVGDSEEDMGPFFPVKRRNLLKLS